MWHVLKPITKVHGLSSGIAQQKNLGYGLGRVSRAICLHLVVGRANPSWKQWRKR